jgi:hypothetical protein
VVSGGGVVESTSPLGNPDAFFASFYLPTTLLSFKQKMLYFR